MSLFSDLIKNISQKRTEIKYAKMMTGMSPVFTSFGNNIYASDIVQNVIRRVCSEMSKLEPHHVVTGADGMQVIKAGSELNRLFRFGPNPLMNTSDFLARVTYLRETKLNAYILPVWDNIPVYGRDKELVGYRRRYTALWPLNPSKTTFKTDDNGEFYVCFTFAGDPGNEYTFRYADIIHWRKDFTESDLVGGYADGNMESTALLKQLETDNIMTQSISNGIKNSNSIWGIIKQNTLLEDEELTEKQKAFEEKIKKNASGFLVMDLKNEFQQVSLNPKMIPSDVAKMVVQRILSKWSMSYDMYNGVFNEEEYQAWYESYLEDQIISLGRELSRKLFTARELEVGNEIICYTIGLQYMSTNNKVAVATILSNIGFLTDNQLGQIFGYPPFEGGNIRHMSLNYVDRDLANEYQMANAGKGGKKNAEADA